MLLATAFKKLVLRRVLSWNALWVLIKISPLFPIFSLVVPYPTFWTCPQKFTVNCHDISGSNKVILRWLPQQRHAVSGV